MDEKKDYWKLLCNAKYFTCNNTAIDLSQNIVMKINSTLYTNINTRFCSASANASVWFLASIENEYYAIVPPPSPKKRGSINLNLPYLCR